MKPPKLGARVGFLAAMAALMGTGGVRTDPAGRAFGNRMRHGKHHGQTRVAFGNGQRSRKNHRQLY